MMLDDIQKAVDKFSSDELRQLRNYLEARQKQVELQAGTLNIDVLQAALVDIRAGLSDEEFAIIEHAMNTEYIETLDNDE